MPYSIIKFSVPIPYGTKTLELNTELLQAAMDRLCNIDAIFSSNSREYLIEKHLNPNTHHLEFHNGLPLRVNAGICAMIHDRLEHHPEFQPPAIINFLNYLNWRFFEDKLFPLSTPLSDFPDAVRASMDDLMDSFDSSIKRQMKAKPEKFMYVFHKEKYGMKHYPLGQFDPKSPYGALRLRKIKEMTVTLQDILSYLLSYIRLHNTSDSAPEKYPLLGSVIAPSYLLSKDITSQNENLNPFIEALKYYRQLKEDED